MLGPNYHTWNVRRTSVHRQFWTGPPPPPPPQTLFNLSVSYLPTNNLSLFYDPSKLVHSCRTKPVKKVGPKRKLIEQQSRLVTKPTKLHVRPAKTDQPGHPPSLIRRRLRSAWASAQSDQSLRCPHEESLGL